MDAINRVYTAIHKFEDDNGHAASKIHLDRTLYKEIAKELPHSCNFKHEKETMFGMEVVLIEEGLHLSGVKQ